MSISGPDPRFEEQKQKVLQLLKNYNDFLAMHTRDSDDPSPPSSDSGDPWPLNAETMKRWGGSAVANSFRALERELRFIRNFTPFVYTPLYDMFLHPEAGDADYERLRKKADSGSVAGKTQAELASIEMALYMLTMRLIADDLYVIFPWRYYSRGSRGKTMEEGYREIHGVFVAECERLSKTRKRYRNQAYKTSAEICEVSVPTVERAVRYVLAGDAA